MTGEAAPPPRLDPDLVRAGEAVSEYGPAAIDALLDGIAERLDEGASVNDGTVVKLLETCKHARGFGQMLEIAEIFSEVADDLRIPILQCQAWIDIGEYRMAARRLQRLLRQVRGLEVSRQSLGLQSEVMGLLGRAYKQAFVCHADEGDRDRAAWALKRAAHFYEMAYDLDPAWHGANLAALAWRAEREGIALPVSAEAAGEKLLHDLAATPRPDAWGVAALAQASMALGDWDAGYSRYGEYFRKLRRIKGRAAAFTLHGDIRQLTEIWLADRGDMPEAAEILSALRDNMARSAIPGCSAQDVAQFLDAIDTLGVDPAVELQAMVSAGEIIPVEEMCRVVRNRNVVARITDQDGVAKGTGFLLDARPFGVTEAHAVLITNNHVLATLRRMGCQVSEDQARVQFQTWDSAPPGGYRIAKILMESPSEQHDITVALIKGLPPEAPMALLKSPHERFPTPRPGVGPLGRVHPIGHPEGGPLSLSLAGNEVVDHDFHRGNRGVRRMHYKANTLAGSSGSPVFGTSGQLVAVHRATTAAILPETRMDHARPYHANEGVGISCVLSWYAGAGTRRC